MKIYKYKILILILILFMISCQKFQEKSDIKKAETVVSNYLNDYLNNYLSKGYIFQKYLHEECQLLGSDKIYFFIIDPNFKIINSVKTNGTIKIQVDITEIALASFNELTIKDYDYIYEFTLKKYKKNWLILRLPNVPIAYLDSAIEFASKNMNDEYRTESEITGYKNLFKNLINLKSQKNNNKDQ